MSLATIVDIRRWLEADRRTPPDRRLERDRSIGRDLGASDRAARVFAWWARLPTADRRGHEDGTGHRVRTAMTAAGVGAAVFGALIGAAAAAAAFAYDGRYPVNLFALLGLLIALPTATLVITLVLLPGRATGWAGVQDTFAALSPARWLCQALDRFLDVDLFRWRGGSGGAGRFAKWQLVLFSEWLAIGFFLGGLTVALVLVAFTDLAFGWSTTLDIDPASVHAWLSALSAPWAAWLPTAAPDAQLVEVSRYYRLDDTVVRQAGRLGDWWPFVCMSVVTYGLAPRVVIALFGAWRLRTAGRHLLLDDPEVTALLDRLDTPIVRYQTEVAGTDLPSAVTSPPVPALAPGGATLVVWNGALPADVAQRWLRDGFSIDVGQVLELGSTMSQSGLDNELGQLREPGARVVIVTKGWEPPLLEFVDFLNRLEHVLDQDVSIAVVPVATTADAVLAQDRDIWAHTLSRTAGANVYVVEAQS